MKTIALVNNKVGGGTTAMIHEQGNRHSHPAVIVERR